MSTPTIPKTARAALIESFGPLTFKEDHPVPQPADLKPGECLVKIDYAGVCHSDIHVSEGGWGPMQMPRIAGHEGIGHIVAIAEHTANSPVKVGDRVGIKWLARVCLNCEFCRTGKESACAQSLTHSSGFRVDGSFSDYVVSYVDYVTPIPENLDSAAATPLLCAGLTIYKALKQTNPQVGNWVAIPGAGGGLGHLGVQYAVAMGLRVIAIDTGDVKRDLVMSLGAEKWIDFKQTTDLAKDVKEATGGLGVHAAIIASGNPEPFTQALYYLRPAGTLVAVGLPSGGAAMQVPIGWLVTFSLHIIGTAIGNRQDVAEALEIAARGKVKCHHEIRDFKEVNQAMADVNAQKVAGRIVLKF